MHSFAVFVLRRAKRARAAGRCADPAAGFSAPPPAGSVFCRKQRKKLQKKAPLPGADSPYQGEMSRRDKRGRDAVSRRLTERLSQIYIKKSNHKFSLRFEKEETGSEEKRLRE